MGGSWVIVPVMKVFEVNAQRTAPKLVGGTKRQSARQVASAGFLRLGGFTIVEVLIVMAVAGVLAAIAVPSMRGMVNDMRLRSAHGLIINDLNLARGEAIKRNTRVLMCVRNADGTDCAAGTNWQSGWVVCYDDDRDGDCDDATGLVPPNPNPLVVRPPLDSTLTLTSLANLVRFNPNSTQGDGTGAATLTLSGTWAGVPSRTVSLANTGDILKP